jgi:hypothetical protein
MPPPSPAVLVAEAAGWITLPEIVVPETVVSEA